MNMKRKDFTSKKELVSGKRLDTGRYTMERISFDDKGTLMCFVTSFLETRHYFNVYFL